MKAGFTKIDARFLEQDTKLEALDTKMTKMMILMEEQNERNKVALDGYATVYEKFQESGMRFEKVEKHVFGSKQGLELRAASQKRKSALEIK